FEFALEEVARLQVEVAGLRGPKPHPRIARPLDTAMVEHGFGGAPHRGIAQILAADIIIRPERTSEYTRLSEKFDAVLEESNPVQIGSSVTGLEMLRERQFRRPHLVVSRDHDDLGGLRICAAKDFDGADQA